MEKIDIAFKADTVADVIICQRVGASTITYTRDGIHPFMGELIAANVDQWNEAARILGWSEDA